MTIGRKAHRTRRLFRAVALAGGSFATVAVSVVALAGPQNASAAPPPGPPPVVTPTPVGGSFVNGEVVSISVGPNSTFTPNSRIVILECAAPGGVPPISDSACDGNTVEYGSVLVGANGSFEERAYRFYQLPDHQLSETPSSLPACNATAECILYIGQDQNDFTQPKTFSAPFTVSPSATPAPVGQPTAPGSGTPAASSAPAAGGAGAAASKPATGGSGGSSATTPPPLSHPSSASAASAPHRDPTSDAAPSGTTSGGSGPGLWLLVTVIVLILLVLAGIGGMRLRRRFAP